ncbi:hypothetical protein N9M73_00530 [Rhodobacteraceae bacterium]|nr:hypothetical protein [Paracoccaceae bacterium]
MKPNFALSLSFDSISLLQRAKTGWSVLGNVNFQKDDLTPKMGRLRKQALGLDPSAAQVKLVIPNEQVKYMTLARPKNALIDDIEALINAHLKNATPYQLSELRFDWATTQDSIFVAAVAIETLQEAEAFAQSCEFKPLGNVAIPPKDSFIGEAFFGSAEGDRRRMECDEQAIVILPNPELIAAPLPRQPVQSSVSQSSVEIQSDKTTDAPQPPEELVFRSQRDSALDEQTPISATEKQKQTLIAPQVTLDPRYAASLIVSAPLDIGRTAVEWASHGIKSTLQQSGSGLHALRKAFINSVQSIDFSGLQRARQQFKQELVRNANSAKQYRAELHKQQRQLRRQAQSFVTKSRADIKAWWLEAQNNLKLSEDLKRTIKPFWPVLLLAPVILVAVAIAAYSLYKPQFSYGTEDWADLDAAPDILLKIEASTLGARQLSLGQSAFPGQVTPDTAPKIANLSPVFTPGSAKVTNRPSKPKTVITDDSFNLDLEALDELPRIDYALGVERLDQPIPGAAQTAPTFSWQTLALFDSNRELVPLERPDRKPIEPTRPDTLRGLYKPMPEWPTAPMPPTGTNWDFIGAIYSAARDPAVTVKDITALPDSANLRPDSNFLLPFLGLSSHNPKMGHDTASILRSIPVAPVPPADMGWDYLGDLYIASIDPPVEVYDAIALPDSAGLLPDPNFIRPLALSFATAALGADDLQVVEELPNKTIAENITDNLRPTANTESDAAVLPQEIAALDTSKLKPETQTPFDRSLRTPLSTEVDLLEDGSSPPDAQANTTSDDGQVSLLEPKPQNTPLIPDRPNMVPEPSAENVPLLTVTGIPLVTVRPPQRPSSLKTPDQKAQEALAALALLRPKVRPAEAVAAIKPLPFEQPLSASLRPKSRPLDLETTQGINFLSRLLSTISEGDEAEVGSGAGTEPSNALVRKQATLKRVLDLRQVNLIGVFGTKSTRRALIRLKSGRRVMVEVGDRLDGGRVAAIAKNELRYIKSGENITLSLPRG